MTWDRPNHEPGDGTALVFLEVHGTFPAAPPVASAAAYGLSAGVDVEVVRLDRDLAERRTGVAWQWFAGDHPELAARVVAAPSALVIRAELPDPTDLAYLRHAVGLAQLFCDHGGLAVHDVQTLRWYPASEWQDQVFAGDFRPHAHVVILTSMDGDRTWIHTRGLRKFGRPDLSIVRVPDDYRDAATDLVNRFIERQVRGGRIPDGQPVSMRSLPEGLVCRHAGSLDDPDFNNVHVEIAWPESVAE